MGSCSQFCLILHPQRVAVPFFQLLRLHGGTALFKWNSFAQIHGGTGVIKAKCGTTPQKRPKFEGGVILWYK